MSMLNLMFDRPTAMEVQRKLADLGFYKGDIDGVFGPLSRKGLDEWRKHSIAATISTPELEVMRAQKRGGWPKGREEFTEFYSAFEYESDASGLVRVLNNWAFDNLLVRDFPFFGRLAVHRKVAVSLHRIGMSLNSVSLDYPIRLVGCYNPRHKGYNPKRTLSAHAFAAAVDLNWDTNGYGTVGDISPVIVRAFQEEGWIWGGEWGGLRWNQGTKMWVSDGQLVRSDPMHFQAGRDW